MKKTIVYLFLLFGIPHFASAQSLAAGIRMMDYQKFHSAHDIFKSLINKNASDSIAIYLMGQADINNNQIEKAIQCYTNANNRHVSDLYSAGLAQCYALTGKMNIAAKILTTIERHNNSSQNQYLTKATGLAYAALHDFEKAGSYFSAAIRLDPKNPSSYLSFAYYALMQGNLTQTKMYLDSAAIQDSNYAPLYFYRSLLEKKSGDTLLFTAYLQKTIAKDSLFMPAWYELYKHAYESNESNIRYYFSKYNSLCDVAVTESSQSLMRDIEQKDFTAIVNRVKKFSPDELLQCPASFLPDIAFGFYSTHHIHKAYDYIHLYMQIQDTLKINNYDIYLAAQLAVRQKNKDSVALLYISKAYDMDTVLLNKKIYAAALVNHYLLEKNILATTIWREKLLPLKELNANEKKRMNTAWYQFNNSGKSVPVFREFLSLYPIAFRTIYMREGIKERPDTGIAEESSPDLNPYDSN